MQSAIAAPPLANLPQTPPPPHWTRLIRSHSFHNLGILHQNPPHIHSYHGIRPLSALAQARQGPPGLHPQRARTPMFCNGYLPGPLRSAGWRGIFCSPPFMHAILPSTSASTSAPPTFGRFSSIHPQILLLRLMDAGMQRRAGKHMHGRFGVSSRDSIFSSFLERFSPRGGGGNLAWAGLF